MSYLSQLEALNSEKRPPQRTAKTVKSPFGSYDSALSRRFSENRTATRRAARLFYDHLFSCGECYAPRGRYCPEGERLRSGYYGHSEATK